MYLTGLTFLFTYFLSILSVYVPAGSVSTPLCTSAPGTKESAALINRIPGLRGVGGQEEVSCESADRCAICFKFYCSPARESTESPFLDQCQALGRVWRTPFCASSRRLADNRFRNKKRFCTANTRTLHWVQNSTSKRSWS